MYITGKSQWSFETAFSNKFYHVVLSSVSENRITDRNGPGIFVVSLMTNANQDHCFKSKHRFTHDFWYIIWYLSTGVMNDDYKGIFLGNHELDTPYSATGFSSTIIAARVSYVFNLQGPCLALDTACSSGLISVHLGSQALLSGMSINAV